jgi:transcriptional regulator with XRE-family HTH domain
MLQMTHIAETMPNEKQNGNQKHLKKMRLERGWSQQQLANKAGLTRRQVASYEKDTEPPMSNLLKILEAFGIIIFKK